MLRLCSLFLILTLCAEFYGLQLRQQGAMIKYCNRKYAANCSAMTRRLKRGDPYTTNITGTSLHTWGNNVTINIAYNANHQGEVTIKQKVCEFVNKNKWFFDYLKTFSNLTTCPLPAGTYRGYNVEFPPKNLPWTVPHGDIVLKIALEITDTQELIADFRMNLHG